MPVDEQHELARAKFIMGFGALFLVSCFMVWSEFAYILHGAKAEATVLRAFDSHGHGRFGRNRGKRLNIEYTFVQADSTFRKDIVTVSNSTPHPHTGDKIDIEYTPGELGRSRLAGHVDWLWIGLFTASLLGLAFFAIKMYREAHADTPRRSKRRR